MAEGILSASIIFEVATALLALRLAFKPGQRGLWLVVSAAFGLMVSRRCVTLYQWVIGSHSRPQYLEAEIVGAVVSFALFLCVCWLAKALDALRASQKRLLESEQRYRSLFGNNHTVMLLIEGDTGSIVDANQAACRFYGYPRERLLGMKITSINTLPPEQVFEEMARAREERRQYFIFRHRLASGEERDVEVYSGPVKAAGSDYLYSIVHDITDRLRMQRELAEAERRFRDTLSHVSLVALTLDEAGRLTFCNDFCLALTGWRREEVLGRCFFDVFIPPEIRSDAREHYERWLASDTLPHHWQNEIQTRGGERRLIAWNNCPLRDDQARTIGAASIGEDITERHRMEVALEDAYRRQYYIAEHLQRALLPEAPSAGEGYEVAAAYVPAYDHLKIGGDFYDVFVTAAGSVALLVGDASGKGVEAAALAAATRSTIRAFAYETSDPAEALTRANAALTDQQVPRGAFVTALLAVLDPHTGRVSYAGGGQPPPVVRRPDGTRSFWECAALPLGVMPGLSYTARGDVVPEGGTLILYTDGLIDARGEDGRRLQPEGLDEVLRRIDSWEPKAVARQLLGEAQEWADGRLTDDAAVVVLRRS